jgi:hypothetical protein
VYRTAAERETVVETPKEKAPPLLLEEEYEEAKNTLEGWLLFAVMLSGCAVAGTALLRAGYDIWLVPSLASAAGAVGCLGGILRCQATIRAWRDHKRRALVKEAARD